jgi:hypothetical protein
MAELKKCPFCGGEAEHEVFNDGFFTLGRVECKQCRAMLTTPPNIVIKAWNNRPTEAEIRAKAIEEFAECLSLGISESLIWGMLPVDCKEGVSDEIVEYVLNAIKVVAEQLKEE